MNSKIFTAPTLMAMILLATSFAGAGLTATTDLAREKGTGMHHNEEGDHWRTPRAAAERPNPIPADRASLKRGEKLYKTHCALCHGAMGRGDGPAAAGLNPKPDDLRVMAGEHPAGDLAWKIAHGRGAMPAWKGTLSDSQIWDLVNYLKSLHQADEKSEKNNRRSH